MDGFVSSGGLGGPAILPLSLAKMSQMTRAFPDRSFSGIGGISDFDQALSYILLGCGTVQVCTAAMLDQAVGPNVIKRLLAGLDAFLERNAARRVDQRGGFPGDPSGPRSWRSREIRRPDGDDYHSGYEAVEGYATAECCRPERSEGSCQASRSLATLGMTGGDHETRPNRQGR